ncbi:MAG: helix-turn-helix transcriptional regulator [Cyclobacteriaceae bacterium]
MLDTSNVMISEDRSFNSSREEVATEASLTLVVPPERLGSYKRKIDRVKKQAAFEKEKRNQFESLTRREIEIVSLLATGFDNPCIAESLFISRNTVEQHRKNIRRKLKVQSFVHLMEYALAFDLV